MALIDSHAHLEMREFDRDRDEVIARAKGSGIQAIITVGTTLRDCEKAVNLAERHEGVYAAIGIHPHDTKDIDGNTYGILKQLARQEKVVAFGEIGLDFFRDHSPREIQIRRFGEQLELAIDIDLPIIIHDRDAHRETLDMLKDWKGQKGGVFHCFSGDVPMARKCLDMGFHISIPGPVTYPKNEKLQAVVRYVPLENLLVETDCPYLTPHPHRGKRNEPAFVVHTAKKVSELKGIPLEEAGRATSDNTRRLFRIP